MKNSVRRNGFTLIELLVVISIIGLLSSIIIGNLHTAQVRARDAKRAGEMHQILLALNLYYDEYGCLPVTTPGTLCPGASGYGVSFKNPDTSDRPGFLGFLLNKGIFSQVPLDPINDATYHYWYYCYSEIDDTVTKRGLRLLYARESDGQIVYVIGGQDGLPSEQVADRSYTCK